MGCGYDYDYLLPNGALSRFLLEMARIWPDWIAELEGGALLRRDEFRGELPPAAESGFVLHRDTQMRGRFHAEGGFVDDDGTSPISVWILGWDEAWMNVDLVIDQLPPSPFLDRVWDRLAWGIADVVMRVKRGTTTTRYLTTMNPSWVRASWPEILKLEPTSYERLLNTPALASILNLQKAAPDTCVIELAADEHLDADMAAFLERCVVRLLGYWHRVVYAEDGKERYTMPPGELRARDGRVEILSGGRSMSWTPRELPALLKSGKGASKS